MGRGWVRKGLSRQDWGTKPDKTFSAPLPYDKPPKVLYVRELLKKNFQWENTPGNTETIQSDFLKSLSHYQI